MRYKRQEIISKVSSIGNERLAKETIGVVGCGGLGSLNLYYLAAAGIKKLIIVDSDIVEESNLNRQIIHSESDIGIPKVYSSKTKINNFRNDIEIETHFCRLDDNNINQIFKDATIIIDCVDNVKTRYILDDSAVLKNKPIFFAGVEEFNGFVYSKINNNALKYREIFEENIKSIYEIGVIGSAVGIISSTQVNEIIKYIINPTDYKSTYLSLNLWDNTVVKGDFNE